MSILTLLAEVVAGVGATPAATSEAIIDVASKLPAWAPIPLTALLTLVAALIFWALFKYARGTTGQTVATVLPSILEAAQGFVPNGPGLDAHDVLNFVKHLSKSAAGALNNIENKQFEDVKDELIAYTKQAAADMGITDVSDAILEKEAQAAFLLIKNFPTLMQQLKK